MPIHILKMLGYGAFCPINGEPYKRTPQKYPEIWLVPTKI